MKTQLLRRFVVMILLLFGSSPSFAQPVQAYGYEFSPAIGPFAPGFSPAIGTIFTGTDAWGLPWFAGSPTLTGSAPLFESSGISSSSTVTDQVILEKVVNFCGHSNIQFRINSGTESDLCWLFVSPNSNPILATEVLALASGDIESIPASTPISPTGGIFIRAYMSDDSDDSSFGIEWMSTEQPFWTPLTDGDFTALNTYPSVVTDTMVCAGSSTTITLTNSDLGTSYVLRDDSDDSWLDGPYQGVGGPLAFNTGPITAEMDFNILSLGPNDALSFDGVDDHVLIPYASNYELTDGVVEVMIRPFDSGTKQTFLAFENSAGTLRRYSFHILAGMTGLGFDNGSTIETISTPVTADTWQTFSFVDDGTDVEAFIDGVSVGTFPTQFGTASDASMNLILGTNGPETEFFTGDIEEVRIYDAAKSSTEISDDLDSCLMGSEANLVGYWKFEDGYGSATVEDVTINGNDGTLTNMDINANWTWSTPLTCSSCDVQMTGPYTVIVPYFFQQVEICSGDSSFHELAWQTEPGTYYDTLTSTLLGCDSIIETDLIVHPVYEMIQPVIVICDSDSALIFGSYETAAGVYYDSLLTEQGCDSVIVQELTVGTSYYTVLDEDYICPFDSVEVFGEYVFLPGTYYDTLTTSTGCDSIFELNVIPSLNPTVGIMSFGIDPICEQGGPILLPIGSPSGGVYSGTGVSDPFFDPTGLPAGDYTTTYTFTTVHGCSKSDSTTISVVNCLGIDDFGPDFQLSIYPNPSGGMFNVSVSQLDPETQIEIYNSTGQLVYQKQLNEATTRIDLEDHQGGIYLLRLSSEKGQVYRQFVID